MTLRRWRVGVAMACATGGAARGGIDLLVGNTRDEYSLFNALLGSEVTEEQVTATLGRLAPALDGSGVYRAPYPEATSGVTV